MKYSIASTGKKHYSNLSINHGGWNEHGGDAKVAISLNVEVGFFGKHIPITLINKEWRVEKI